MVNQGGEQAMKNLLWKPFRIGQMELRNRIAMAPITAQYASKEGRVTKRQKDHYEARARGGAGLLLSLIHISEPTRPY